MPSQHYARVLRQMDADLSSALQAFEDIGDHLPVTDVNIMNATRKRIRLAGRDVTKLMDRHGVSEAGPRLG